MDDDGLMLNFAAPSGPMSGPTAKKRLNAKERQQQQRQRRWAGSSAAQKSTQQQQQQQLQTPSSASSSTPIVTHSSDQTAASPAAKEGSVSASAPPGGRQSRPTTRPRPEGSNSGPAPTPRNGFISSLFTGIDSSTRNNKGKEAAAIEEDEARVSKIPSNAPAPGASFSACGLDELLVSHLASPRMTIGDKPTSIQRNSLPFLLSQSSLDPSSSSTPKLPTATHRDALLHAQTGSGKTLAYLLPIIQSLLPLCSASWIDRGSVGTLAIILAPTRELARQIYEVAESLCNLHLRLRPAGGDDDDENEEADGREDEANTVRRTRWIVPGLLSGGSTKNHEKSRLRKGLPLIVATPGRLLDHLRNTATLDVGRLQWLVLDEADRLLQMGFEETLTDILKALDARRRSAVEVQRNRMREELGTQASTLDLNDEDNIEDSFGIRWWRYGRRTVLCSATLDEGVQVLAGKSLVRPRVIRGDAKEDEEIRKAADSSQGKEATQPMAAPSQLDQRYVIVPTKQRLILLVALLRQIISSASGSTATFPKIMVFASCTDSVDFHFRALAGARMTEGASTAEGDEAEDEGEKEKAVELDSDLLPSVSLFRLHGSMAQSDRSMALKRFSRSANDAGKKAAVLFCTSVASRGLDLSVSHVIQLDPPTERGADEYVHRIGRTARAGKAGQSWLFLLPSEEGAVARYASGSAADITIRPVDPAVLLKKGFASQELSVAQLRATAVQLALEGWALKHKELATKAYKNHLRAYATHPPAERDVFGLRKLQLGHLAKSFGLRDRPGEMKGPSSAATAKTKTSKDEGRKRKAKPAAELGEEEDEDEEDEDILDQVLSKRSKLASGDASTREEGGYGLTFERNKDSESRMYAKVRQLGKLSKKAGVLGAHGADEFQLA